jgi:hypothetical protein
VLLAGLCWSVGLRPSSAQAPEPGSAQAREPSSAQAREPSSAQPEPSSAQAPESTSAEGSEPASEPRFRWLPGDARQISHASSASRDTALLEGILYPRISVTLGSEFGLLRYRAGPVSLRLGLFALFNLESRTKAKHFFPAPGGDSDLWRGVLGYELTCAFERFAQRHMGEAGALELALGYYHESEHHSAGNNRPLPGDGPDHPELRGRPQLNNFVMADVAARNMWAKFELVGRIQGKAFANGPATPHEPFRIGVGGDLIVRARHLSWLQPFSANFLELLISPVRRDANTFRSLLGVAFPGVFGELSLYLSLTTGAGKGLLIPVNDTDFGGGLRYSPFRS